MRAQHKAKFVEALRLEEDLRLKDVNPRDIILGRITGKIGDWLIIEDNQLQYIVTNELFLTHFDQVDSDAPIAPVVTSPEGASTTNTQPKWTWGNVVGSVDIYRVQLDAEADDAWIDVGNVFEFTPDTPLTIATHTLFVQVRDAWHIQGASGSFAIDIIL